MEHVLDTLTDQTSEETMCGIASARVRRRACF